MRERKSRAGQAEPNENSERSIRSKVVKPSVVRGQLCIFGVMESSLLEWIRWSESRLDWVRIHMRETRGRPTSAVAAGPWTESGRSRISLAKFSWALSKRAIEQFLNEVADKERISREKADTL